MPSASTTWPGEENEYSVFPALACSKVEPASAHEDDGGGGLAWPAL
jgi:hypothetical protein